MEVMHLSLLLGRYLRTMLPLSPLIKKGKLKLRNFSIQCKRPHTIANPNAEINNLCIAYLPSSHTQKNKL